VIPIIVPQMSQVNMKYLIDIITRQVIPYKSKLTK